MVLHIVVRMEKQKTATTLLAIALIISTLYIVLRYYLTPSATVTIIQSKISEFDVKLLFDKDPIILEEKVVDPSEILQAYFNYLYSIKFRVQPTNQWSQNKSRYLIVFNAETLQIAHPSNKGSPIKNFIDIRLQPKQLMILPSLWLYKVKGGTLFALYDIPAIVLSLFV